MLTGVPVEFAYSVELSNVRLRLFLRAAAFLPPFRRITCTEERVLSISLSHTLRAAMACTAVQHWMCLNCSACCQSCELQHSMLLLPAQPRRAHLHRMNQLLFCVKHQLDTAMRPAPQLLDNEVLVDKHIALQEHKQAASTATCNPDLSKVCCRAE